MNRTEGIRAFLTAPDRNTVMLRSFHDPYSQIASFLSEFRHTTVNRLLIFGHCFRQSARCRDNAQNGCLVAVAEKKERLGSGRIKLEINHMVNESSLGRSLFESQLLQIYVIKKLIAGFGSKCILPSSVKSFKAMAAWEIIRALAGIRRAAMPFLYNSAFTSEDLDVLRGALDAWCAEKRIDIKSVEAQFAASTALDLYQSGYDDHDRLLSAMRGHKSL